jgi:membrane-anchored protein YejM (alkaline phosphatase superfamily)
MSRRPTRTVVHATALIAVVAIAVGACVARPPSRPADVVLIVIDTLRADHVSLYGYPRRTAPALEAFARDAVTYDDAISPGTWTVPSHAAIFTGRWPSFAGAERVAGDHNLAMPINDAAPTLAELLSRSQFHTAAFVANTAYVARALGFARGFDEFADWNLSTANRLERAFRLWLPTRNDRVFVFMNILDPHEPYDPPGAYKRLFPGRVRSYGTIMTDLVDRGTPVTPELQAHFVSQYDGEVAFTDHVLGEIFDDLKRAHRYDSALVIVTSDHGELLGEHGVAGHGGAPYEPLVHVPLIVKLPGNARAGERVARRVSTLGIFQTILSTVGVAAPPGTQSQALDTEHAVWVEDVSAAGERVRVGYEGPLKLVTVTSDTGVRTALYDLGADATEERPAKDGNGAAGLRTAVASFAAVDRPVNTAPVAAVDPEREWKLRALGYIR